MEVGSHLFGFEIESVLDLPEINSLGVFARHIKSGMGVCHLLSDDKENVASFNFLTPPEDDCGTAHVIEHSVLSGSDSFPLKDVFFNLSKKSVATFLNAMTFPEFTAFPIASVVEKDFYNLLKCYGDAVFFPTLDERTFKTEGVRLDLKDDEPFVNGIVYNEMKGVFSDVNSVVSRESLNLLFPDIFYRYESGGDPISIPNLTYSKFKEFHKKFYNPKNCRLFFYGNIPTEKHLEFLEREFMSKFDFSDSNLEVEVPKIEIQKRWSSPRFKEVIAPKGSDDEKNQVIINWMLEKTSDIELTIALSIISDILVGSYSGVLYKALSESGLGEDVSPMSGIDTGLGQSIFACGLRGVELNSLEESVEVVAKKIENFVLDFLKEFKFSQDLIDSAISKIEFSLKEISGKEPLGLKYLDRVLKGWFYKDEPFSNIEISKYLEDIKKKSKEDTTFFDNILNKYFVENSHRLLLFVKPSDSFFSDLKDIEKLNAKKMFKNYYSNSLDSLKKDCELLREYQDLEDDSSLIPSLSREDVDVDLVDYTPIEKNGFLEKEVFSNGVAYLDMAFDIKSIDNSFAPYLSILIEMMRQGGTKDKSYDELAREINLYMGSYSLDLEIDTDIESDNDIAFLVVKSKFLKEKRDDAFRLLKILLKDIVVEDLSRLKIVLTEMRNDYKSMIISRGSVFASDYAKSFMSKKYKLVNECFGLPLYKFICNILEDESELKKCANILSLLYRKVINSDKSFFCLGGDRDSLDFVEQSMPEFKTFLSNISLEPDNSFEEKSLEQNFHKSLKKNLGNNLEGELFPQNIEKIDKTAILLETASNFNAMVFKSAKYPSKDYVCRAILSEILDSVVIDEIRVNLGAYGAVSKNLSGAFLFSSYRDPNIDKTYNYFDTVLEDFLKDGIDEDDFEDAIISLMGNYLKPRKPATLVYTSFIFHLKNISLEKRNIVKNITLETTIDDVEKEISKLIEESKKSHKVSILSKEAFSNSSMSKDKNVKIIKVD